MTATPSVMSLKDAADQLGLSYRRALDWVQKGQLKTTRLGAGQHMVSPEDLETFRVWWTEQGHAKQAAGPEIRASDRQTGRSDKHSPSVEPS